MKQSMLFALLAFSARGVQLNADTEAEAEDGVLKAI